MDFNPQRAARVDHNKKFQKESKKIDLRYVEDFSDYDDEEETDKKVK